MSFCAAAMYVEDRTTASTSLAGVAAVSKTSSQYVQPFLLTCVYLRVNIIVHSCHTQHSIEQLDNLYS